MELTSEQIEKINNACPSSEQGIYIQPYGIPVNVKEYVIYSRWKSGGYSGGSCWDSSNPQPYENETPKDYFKVLDLVLKELMPSVTYLQYKEISALVHTNEEIEREYYGNSTEYKIEYIVLKDLINLLESF